MILDKKYCTPAFLTLNIGLAQELNLGDRDRIVYPKGDILSTCRLTYIKKIFNEYKRSA